MELIKLIPTEHECSWTANKEREQFWRRRYAQLEEWTKTNPGALPKALSASKDERMLYNWLYSQKSANREGQLHAFQIEQPGQLPGVLERSGSVPANAWGESCNQLKEWIESNPGSLPRRATTDKDKRRLFWWFCNQKSALRQGRLDSDRMELLKILPGVIKRSGPVSSASKT